jgi:peptidoglycan hydrolase-like protein with peptidoglycan-binding domain
MALERRLDELRYDVGAVDGLFDANTGHAVMAFQKVHGMPRTSRATQDVRDRLTAAGPPGELVPGGGANRVEIDLKRQVLFLYRHGALLKILPVSTGNGKRYCVEGDCAVAVTPGGSFRVKRYIRGWRESRLGLLYNPLYFNGGIAIHGSKSVPGYPASHGCVRIPMFAAGWFPQQVPLGTPVYVFGGPRAPVPFDEPTPGETTTTAPTSTTSTIVPPETTSSTAPTTTAPPPTTTTTTIAPAPTTTVVP